MRRILSWLAVIIAPTALWLVVTANGHAALQLMFSHRVGADRLRRPSVKAMPSGQGHLSAHPVVLIPAYPAPKNPELQVRLYGNETIKLYVVDQKGRRSGIDPQSALTLRRIPHSTVQRASVIGSDGAKDEAITVTVDPALSMVYALVVSAKRSGDYRLVVKGVSPALKTVRLMRNDHVAEDTLMTYRVSLKDIKPLPPFGVPGVVNHTVTPATDFVSSPQETVVEPTAPALVAAAQSMSEDPCGYFYGKLKAIPHQQLERAEGKFQSVYDDKTYSGCQVVMVTKADFPHFLALDGSYLHRLGWRENYSYAADGANGGMHAIENASERCLFSYEFPDKVDRRTGEAVPSSKVTLTIQCRRKRRKVSTAP